MPKGILEFQLPEEDIEFRTAANAATFTNAIYLFRHKLRTRFKHHDQVLFDYHDVLGLLAEAELEAGCPEPE